MNVRKVKGDRAAKAALVILADDFTGAAEAAAYLGAGTAIRDGWDGSLRQVVLAPTRELKPDQAVRYLNTVRLPDQIPLVVKMDSLGRGPYLAVLEHLGARFPSRLQLICPAFPEQGRVVSGGWLYLHGRPMVDFRVGTDGCVDDVLAVVTAPTPVQKGVRRLVVNAETNDQLAEVAKIVADPRVLIACSSGLLSRLGLWGGLSPPELAPRSVLVVVGSRTELARQQVAALMAAKLPVRVITPPAEDVPRHVVARLLTERVKSVLEPESAIVAVGGETALDLWHALSWPDPVSLGVLEPGIPVLTVPGTQHVVVTKSGSFGDSQCLVRIASWAGGGSEK